MYSRRKSSKISFEMLINEINFLRITIMAVTLYRRFDISTRSNINDVSKERAFSLENIKSSLYKYVAEKKNETYKKLADHLCAQILLALKTNIRTSNITETCSHCNSSLEVGALMCANGHTVRRCCITQLQVLYFG